MRSVENAECCQLGVWKMRECGNWGVQKIRSYKMRIRLDSLSQSWKRLKTFDCKRVSGAETQPEVK